MSPLSEHSSLRAQCRTLLERSLEILEARTQEDLEHPKLPEMTEGEFRYVRVLISAYKVSQDEIPHAPETQPNSEAPKTPMRSVSSEDLRRFLKVASQAQLS